MPIDVNCNYCGILTKIVKGEVLYGCTHKLSSKHFYYCEQCKAWVGMHEKTKKPFGTLAKASLRKQRVLAHNSFDKLWEYMIKNKKMNKKNARQQAYLWLAKELNLSFSQCHIAMFDIATCRQVIKLCTERYQKEIEKVEN